MTDIQLSKYLTILADLCSHLEQQSTSLGQTCEWVQLVDGQLSAGCCLESELLERLLVQNMSVHVKHDLEALEALLRRNDVAKCKENLVYCLAAASTQANCSFTLNYFNFGYLLIVCSFKSLLVEFFGIPLALVVQLDCVTIQLDQAFF